MANDGIMGRLKVILGLDNSQYKQGLKESKDLANQAVKHISSTLENISTPKLNTKQFKLDLDRLKYMAEQIAKQIGDIVIQPKISNATPTTTTKPTSVPTNSLEALTKLQKEYTAELKKLEIGSSAYDTLSLEIADVTAQLNKQRSEQRSLAKEMQAPTNSIAAMRVNLSELKGEWANLDRIANKTRFDEVKKQINSVTAALNEAEQEIGVFGRNVGNYPKMTQAAEGYANKLSELLGVNQDVLESLTKSGASGGAISGAFTQMGVGAKAFGNTLLGLLKNPVFLIIAGIAAIGSGFKFWYDYNKGIAGATKLTKDFTNLSGVDLKSHRVGVQTLANFYEKDFKEVLMSVNAVSKQFGISQKEALTLVKDGFISGGDANGEYLQTLKEYPTFFEEAGLSASQFIAIVAQSAKAGIHSDKGVDAIKEGMLSLREMSDSTKKALDGIGISSTDMQKGLEDGSLSIFDAIQQVSQKMGELPANSAKVGSALTNVFKGAGEEAGLGFITGVSTINTSLEEVKTQSAGVLGELQEELMASQEVLSNTLSALFDDTGGGFEKMTTGVRVFINDGINSMILGLVNIINHFIELYNESEIFVKAISFIGTAMQSAVQVSLVPLKVLWTSLKSVGLMMKSALTGDWEGLKQAGIDGANSLKSIFADTGTKISDDFAKVFDDTLKRKKIEPIIIPVSTSSTTTSASGTTPATDTDPETKEQIYEGGSANHLAKQLSEAQQEMANINTTTETGLEKFKNLSVVINDISEKIANLPQNTALVPPTGSLADYDKQISDLTAKMQYMTGAEIENAQAKLGLLDVQRALANGDYSSQLEKEVNHLNALTEAYNKAEGASRSMYAAQIEAQEKVVAGFDTTKINMKAFNEQISGTLEKGISDSLAGVGEMIGGFMSGNENAWQSLLSPIAGMMVQLGEMAIQAGVATLGIKLALKDLNPYVAIAAGIALVALGTAIKGSMGNIASGGSGDLGSSGNTFTGGGGYSNSGAISPSQFKNQQEVNVQGEFRLAGTDLVASISKTNKFNSR